MGLDSEGIPPPATPSLPVTLRPNPARPGHESRVKPVDSGPWPVRRAYSVTLLSPKRRSGDGTGLPVGRDRIEAGRSAGSDGPVATRPARAEFRTVTTGAAQGPGGPGFARGNKEGDPGRCGWPAGARSRANGLEPGAGETVSTSSCQLGHRHGADSDGPGPGPGPGIYREPRPGVLARIICARASLRPEWRGGTVTQADGPRAKGY